MLKIRLNSFSGALLLMGSIAALVLTACSGTSTADTPSPTASQPAVAATSPTITPPAMIIPSPTKDGAGPNAAILAQGKLLYEKTSGGVGCAHCHGMDGKGNGPAQVNAPRIRGKTEADVRAAVSGGVPMMVFIKLRDAEFEALAAYLQYLDGQP